MMALTAAFLMALLLTWWLASDQSPLTMLDEPNSRSLHEHLMPHSGGAILAAIAVAWGLLAYLYHWHEAMSWISGGPMLVAGVSAMDDLKELSPLLRIAIHAIAAATLIVGGLSLTGLAGWMSAADVYVWYAAAIAAAVLGFLLLSFPPAKILMGDAGSITLGLLAAAFSLWRIRDGVFAWWFPVLVFSPFIMDATITLTRRILNRERIWKAHCSHYYQQLVQSGWGHKKTVLAEYVLMISCGASGLLAERLHMPILTASVLIAWAIAYGVIAIFIHRHTWADAA